jgi:hypothetical protein
VEALLDAFADDGSPEGALALREAARSLKRFTQVSTATPTPPPTTIGHGLDPAPEPAADTPSPTSGLTVSTAPAKPQSIPPEIFAPQPLRSPRATARWTAALLVLGLVGVGAVWLHYPAFFAGKESPLAQAPEPVPTTAVVAAPSRSCWSEVEVRDLPSPHEVLLRLGATPIRDRSMPTGRRLELVVTAAGHRAQRLVVPADREWDGKDGRLALHLETTLAPTEQPAWPAASPGTVGGVGPAGALSVTAEPATSEVWLVIAAGSGDRTTTAVPCDREAALLVVNPADPGDARRLTVPPGR